MFNRKLKRGLNNLFVMYDKEEVDFRTRNFNDIDQLYKVKEKWVCTCCDKNLSRSIKKGEFYKHPALEVLLCKKCLDYYKMESFSPDVDGDDKNCRWCAKGGKLFCCSQCVCTFCEKCINHHFKDDKELISKLNSDFWECFLCDATPIWGLRAICWAIDRLIKHKFNKKSNKYSPLPLPSTSYGSQTHDNATSYNDSNFKQIIESILSPETLKVSNDGDKMNENQPVQVIDSNRKIVSKLKKKLGPKSKMIQNIESSNSDEVLLLEVKQSSHKMTNLGTQKKKIGPKSFLSHKQDLTSNIVNTAKATNDCLELPKSIFNVSNGLIKYFKIIEENQKDQLMAIETIEIVDSSSDDESSNITSSLGMKFNNIDTDVLNSSCIESNHDSIESKSCPVELIELDNDTSDPIELENDTSNPIELNNDPSNALELNNDTSQSFESNNVTSKPIETNNDTSELNELNNDPSKPSELSEISNNNKIHGKSSLSDTTAVANDYPTVSELNGVEQINVSDNEKNNENKNVELVNNLNEVELSNKEEMFHLETIEEIVCSKDICDSIDMDNVTRCIKNSANSFNNLIDNYAILADSIKENVDKIRLAKLGDNINSIEKCLKYYKILENDLKRNISSYSLLREVVKYETEKVESNFNRKNDNTNIDEMRNLLEIININSETDIVPVIDSTENIVYETPTPSLYATKDNEYPREIVDIVEEIITRIAKENNKSCEQVKMKQDEESDTIIGPEHFVVKDVLNTLVTDVEINEKSTELRNNILNEETQKTENNIISSADILSEKETINMIEEKIIKPFDKNEEDAILSILSSESDEELPTIKRKKNDESNADLKKDRNCDAKRENYKKRMSSSSDEDLSNEDRDIERLLNISSLDRKRTQTNGNESSFKTGNEGNTKKDQDKANLKTNDSLMHYINGDYEDTENSSCEEDEEKKAYCDNKYEDLMKNILARADDISNDDASDSISESDSDDFDDLIDLASKSINMKESESDEDNLSKTKTDDQSNCEKIDVKRKKRKRRTNESWKNDPLLRYELSGTDTSGDENDNKKKTRRNTDNIDDNTNEKNEDGNNIDTESDSAKKKNDNEDDTTDSDFFVLKNFKINNRKSTLKSTKNEEITISSDKSSLDSDEYEPDKKKIKSYSKRKTHFKDDDDDNKTVIIVSSDSDSDMDTNKQTVNVKGRRNIRQILTNEDLTLATLAASKQEDERKLRIGKRQKVYEKFVNDKSKLVLDFDTKTKKETITVHHTLVSKLKSHQIEGIQFMWNACFESVDQIKNGHKGSGCVLAHCMGLGKTLQVIALVHTILTHKETNMKRVLIVAPKNTIQNWMEEFRMWLKDIEYTKKIKISNLIECKAQRYGKLEHWYSNGGVLIMGYNMFRNLVNNEKQSEKMKSIVMKSLLKPGPDLIVCDEGHILKNESTGINQAMSQIKTKRRIILTGTPLQNNLEEYHCMIQFIRPNLLGDKKEFKNRFANPINNGQYIDSTPNDVTLMKSRAYVLYKMLDGIVQRKDFIVLKSLLPTKYEYVIKLKLSELQIKLYSHYLTSVMTRSPDDNRFLFTIYQILKLLWTHPYVLLWSYKNRLKKNNNEDKSKHNSEAVANMLQRNKFWWSHLVTLEDVENYKISNKLVAFMLILKECQRIGDKMLVFSQSLGTLNLLEHFLQKMSLSEENCSSWNIGLDYYRMDGSTSIEKRSEFVKSFNNPHNKRARVFLISTKAGGLGINLVAANRVILFDVSWNPSHDVQSIFRIFRFGQTKSCYIYRFVAEGTMEEKIYDRQVTKQSLACRVIDEQQIDRHFTRNDIEQLLEFNPSEKKERRIPAFPKDPLMADLVKEMGSNVVSFHEHDDLLENIHDEELNEYEQKIAWEEYEREKSAKKLVTKNIFNSHHSFEHDDYVGDLNDLYVPVEQSPTTSSALINNNHREKGFSYDAGIDIDFSKYDNNVVDNCETNYERVNRLLSLTDSNEERLMDQSNVQIDYDKNSSSTISTCKTNENENLVNRGSIKERAQNKVNLTVNTETIPVNKTNVKMKQKKIPLPEEIFISKTKEKMTAIPLNKHSNIVIGYKRLQSPENEDLIDVSNDVEELSMKTPLAN